MTGRRRTLIAAVALAGWMVVMPAGVASADCTGAGDFGAGSGCPPPNSSSDSGNTESWPPTSVDWPPQLSSDSDSSDSGSGTNGDTTKATPIVVPDGQTAPPATAASKPIVGSSSTSTSTSSTPTPIVVPNTGG